MDDIYAWWKTVVASGSLAGFKLGATSIQVPKDTVRKAFHDWRVLNRPDSRKVQPVEFTKRLKIVASPLDQVRNRVGTKREWSFVIPSLATCRKNVEPDIDDLLG